MTTWKIATTSLDRGTFLVGPVRIGEWSRASPLISSCLIQLPIHVTGFDFLSAYEKVASGGRSYP